ncbi:hypothetical protein Tco_0486800 [Tanacetum coccineum]
MGRVLLLVRRQPKPTMAHRVDYSLVDTMETRFRDTERRMMTALEMVNMRVSYQVDVRSRESSEFYHDITMTRRIRAAVRAESEAILQGIRGRVTVVPSLEAGARVDTLEDTGSSS